MAIADLENYRTLTNLNNIGLKHGFSFRPDGNMSFKFGEPDIVLRNRLEFLDSLEINIEDLIVMRPEHKDNILVVGRNNARGSLLNITPELPPSDALITTEKGIALALNPADCPPIIITSPKREFVSLVHAGREGTTRQICRKVMDKLNWLGFTDTENFIFGVGPSIHQDCYALGYLDTLADHDCNWGRFLKIDGGPKCRWLKDRYRYESMIYNGKVYPDIVGYSVWQLKEFYGVIEDNIEVSPICTYCQAVRGETFSHVASRENPGIPEGRFMAVVSL